MKENIALVRGNCLVAMNDIPDNSVDMILCDLPYGITQNKWDSVLPFDELWNQYKRVTRANSAIVLFGAKAFGARLVVSNIREWKQSLIWVKNCSSNFLNANRQHLAIHEEIHVFCANTLPYNPQMRIGKPYIERRGNKQRSGENYGSMKMQKDTINKGNRYPTTIIKFNVERGLHSTQKPVALLEYLIKTYTSAGETVLDNCMGSGSTGVAAVNLNRKFIGIELDSKYFKIAKKRIDDARSQLS